MFKNLYFKKRYGRLNKQNNPYASIFFYHVLIKYKNNFTLLPENLLREKKIVCFWGTAASYDFAVYKSVLGIYGIMSMGFYYILA